MGSEIFGNKLRTYRLAAGFTQKEVSEMLHLKNPSTLGSWEIGKSEPDAATFLKLCEIYKIDDIMYAFTGRSLRQNTLSTEQQKLIDIYQNLNYIGKQKADDYIQDLSEQPKYTNPNIISRKDDTEPILFAARGKQLTPEEEEEALRGIKLFLENISDED